MRTISKAISHQNQISNLTQTNNLSHWETPVTRYCCRLSQSQVLNETLIKNANIMKMSLSNTPTMPTKKREREKKHRSYGNSIYFSTKRQYIVNVKQITIIIIDMYVQQYRLTVVLGTVVFVTSIWTITGPITVIHFQNTLSRRTTEMMLVANLTVILSDWNKTVNSYWHTEYAKANVMRHLWLLSVTTLNLCIWN